ncbi:hypothetical protein NQ317_001944 [Molorchus minor]|uniref:PiggyBac transposable element-derived protein domain-containing protein n=1 Tax=Molorchus minor TaxID=1323400 RepID=A0ABQ9JBY5_9CUCU|nr:hypothetical protein NQ317_001944 [Molorchus minor]
MSTMRHYWSQNPLFKNSLISDTMPRTRFELLLKMWHFSNNETCPEGDRIYKVEPLIKIFVNKCQEVYVPGEIVCIDETLIPFRGRLLIKQYIPNKTHKGFTWNMKLYAGKERDPNISVPTKTVMFLAEKLLNAGRTIITDNYYTSLELANQLLNQKTHLLGTLRSNRRGNPKEVVNKKIKSWRNYCERKWSRYLHWEVAGQA